MPTSLHLLQERQHGCVAACIGVLAARAGVVLSQGEILEGLGEPPYGIRRAGRYGAYRWCDFEKEQDVAYFLGVAANVWCMAGVCGGPAAAVAQAAELTSPYGALACVNPQLGHGSLWDVGKPHHAVVVIEIRDGSVRYLDPFFRADGQPIEIGLEPFVQNMWLGDLFTWHRR